MYNQSWLKLVEKHRAIAVIRAPQMELGRQMALAVASGGMQLIEITWNSDKAAELIAHLRSELPNCTIGTGTILNLEQLKSAIASGTQFVFTPHVDPTLIKAANDSGVPMVPGALSPTEIVTAWATGASCVKVFPRRRCRRTEIYKKFARAIGTHSFDSHRRRNPGKCQRISTSRSDRRRSFRQFIPRKGAYHTF